jgi:hypothetical protein
MMIKDFFHAAFRRLCVWPLSGSGTDATSGLRSCVTYIYIYLWYVPSFDSPHVAFE